MLEADALKELQLEAIELAQKAGEQILRVYNTAFTVDQKHDESPVTEADLAAHEIICAGLQALTPDKPLLSEEGAPISYAERKSWRYYWLIDPLDGTREFVKRNGEFSINIALIEAHSPVLGVVAAPVLNRIYFASRGNGAFRQNSGEAPQPIRVRSQAREPLIVAGSRSFATAQFDRYVRHLGDHQLVQFGSALKACLVAEGEIDLYPRFGPTSEWDTAAAQCILEQAGGKLTDQQLRPLRYNAKESLINPSFFAFGDSSRDWSRYLHD